MIPPLHYDYVYRVKQAFPGMCIVINGNITNLDAVNAHLEHVDGVMLGRLACDNPYALVGIYQRLYPECEILTRTQLVRAYVDFLKTNPLHNASRSHVLKPLLNLAHGLPSARLWKSGVLAIESSDDWQGFEHALDCLQRLEMHQPLCGRSENQSVQDD
jgi:tRNA-dihydrouridine synthase A